MLALQLLSLRIDAFGEHVVDMQAQSWALDCLVRLWASMDLWQRTARSRPAYGAVAAAFLRTLLALIFAINSHELHTMLASRAASLLTRSITRIIQLCMTSSYPALEPSTSSTIRELLRLSSKTNIYLDVVENDLRPALQELFQNQGSAQALTPELQVFYRIQLFLGNELIRP